VRAIAAVIKVPKRSIKQRERSKTKRKQRMKTHSMKMMI
jgi:hypothetical protein